MSNARRISLGYLFAFSAFFVGNVSLLAQHSPPVLEFPQKGMDDESAYQGYATRFFRDSDGNTVQISTNAATGRIVHLWADAANESISFTIRSGGKPAAAGWNSPGIVASKQGGRRLISHRLRIPTRNIELGHFLLCSMRKERNFVYQEKHLQPFDAEPYIEPEYPALIANLEKLPPERRAQHLKLLRANNPNGPDELRSRLVPTVKVDRNQTEWIIQVNQQTLDGKNLLSLQITIDPKNIMVAQRGGAVRIEATAGDAIELEITIGTDSPSLTPLMRSEILNDEFLAFFNREKQRAVSHDDTIRFRWLDRQVKSLELLSSHEKLMAGLPNFATYFGRDMMMSAFMMEPVWKPEMLQYVLGSVLGKLRLNGEVSHEEALGGQAIKENAAEYNRLMEQYLERSRSDTAAGAETLLAEAMEILRNLQRVRENYIMLDDDFQLPVLAGRYFARADIPRDRKRNFLLMTSPHHGGRTRLSLLLLNLRRIVELAAPYAERQDSTLLIAFPRWNGRWFPGSWRDSQAGYANGMYAMDINALWVPEAVHATGIILRALKMMGYSADSLFYLVPELRGSTLIEWTHNPALLDRAEQAWRGASRHFLVSTTADEMRAQIQSRLELFPESERSFWKSRLESLTIPANLDYLALSLDSLARPIPIPNTDPATLLFIGAQSLPAQELLRAFVTLYPVGLFVENLGPLAANDTYAPQAVWEEFRRDRYHSPYVVWGREVNLLLLGLVKRTEEARNTGGMQDEAHLYSDALRKTLAAVEASGLKHNELWTYRIDGTRIVPVRYPTGSDIQLWNVTDLSVQFLLARTLNE